VVDDESTPDDKRMQAGELSKSLNGQYTIDANEDVPIPTTIRFFSPPQIQI
jgi:hypothetical protein